MAISRSRNYIDANPRFALTIDSIPRLQRGQMTMVYKALTPHPKAQSLEELAERCSAQGYEETYKQPIPPSESWSFLRMSLLYHLKRMQERGIIREL
jgi:hypothetical protein